MRAVFYRILSRLGQQEEAHAASPASRKIREAIAYLNAHLTDPALRVEAVAQRAGISRRYFERLFLAELGTSAREYILARRMELARELLLNERLGVGDVATRVGFTDAYHFSKIFKEKCALSPSVYKRRMRAEETTDANTESSR